MTTPYDVVLVRWVDSGSSAGWLRLKDATGAAVDEAKEPLESVGFLIADDEFAVVLAIAYNGHVADDPDVCGTMVIPKAQVMSVEVIKAAEATE